ncbi:MAG: carbon monoxide dehydrogenase [Betaproteobacteria bacterium HGW-Betaproteobacteria-3]|jgi:carbon monoxide dehydrogenase subunit G|nr:MAG: carbon monoxide dehydrogenase [Betaproteobacteria bacterium HGW-Betaproteobacteria-3]
MEVTLEKQYPVAASLEAAWQVLSDVSELATCMPGAQITEQLDAAHYRGSVKVKVGPAVASFSGTIEVLALDPQANTIRLVGKGADKGGSSASMELTASLVAVDAQTSTLKGKADVIVNGKFAQFGGRMMGSVSDMILVQFAEVFSQKAQAIQRIAEPATEGVTTTAAAPPVAAREFNALALAWALVRNFFARLFGQKS